MGRFSIDPPDDNGPPPREPEDGEDATPSERAFAVELRALRAIREALEAQLDEDDPNWRDEVPF